MSQSMSGTRWGAEDIYPWPGNLNDAEVCFESVSSNVYRIRLAHHTGYYLTAQGAASGSNVVWAAQNGSSIYQQWRVERVSDSTPPPTPSGFVYPSTSRNVTQHYNAYSHPAVDIRGAFRSAIYAFADGVVAFRQTQPINWLPDVSNPPFGNNSMETMGNCVAINHNNPNTKLYAGSYARTIYMHLEDMRVNPGDMVKKGQLIGSMGTTGRSSGVHLHFCLAVGNLSSMAPGQGGWVSLDLLPKINPAIYLPEWK